MEDNKLIYYDSESGLYVASEEDIKQSLKDVITEAYGDVYLDDNYPDGIVINGLTKMISNTFQTVQTIYNMLDINTAEGVILDTLGDIRNEHRKKATTSNLKALITVVLNEPVVQDTDYTFTVNTFTVVDENNNYWKLTADVTVTVLEDSTTGSATASFESVTTGVKQQPNSLSIKSMDNNLLITENNVVLTLSSFSSGQDDESDIEFRARLNTYTVFNSVTLKENLSSKLLDLNYIKDIKIYYNNSTLPLDTKGSAMTLPSGYMVVLIKPSDTTDFTTNDKTLREEVLKVIGDYKGLGTLCYMPASTATADPGVVTITNIGTGYISTTEDPENPGTYLPDYISEFIVPEQYEIPNTVEYDTELYASLSISYVETEYFDNTPTDPTDPTSDPVSITNAKNIIAFYINNKGIGDNLSAGELATFINSNLNDLTVSYIEIGDAVKGVLANNDKILYVDVDKIHMELES